MVVDEDSKCPMWVMGVTHHIGKEDKATLGCVKAIPMGELMEQEGFLLVEVSMRRMTWLLVRTFPSFTPLIQSSRANTRTVPQSHLHHSHPPWSIVPP